MTTWIYLTDYEAVATAALKLWLELNKKISVLEKARNDVRAELEMEE